ncbi:MAG: hypothetical protein R3C99_09485 [Pirellulaceae bacterium]
MCGPSCDGAWQDSRANAPFTILKREEGGYIYYNQHTGHVEMDRAPSGTYNSIHKHPPQLDGGRRILLADYHVHPNQRFDRSPSGHPFDPYFSPADTKFNISINRYAMQQGNPVDVQAIILTHEGVYWRAPVSDFRNVTPTAYITDPFQGLGSGLLGDL